MIHLLKSKLVIGAKLGLLFRFNLCFVENRSLDPISSSNSGELRIFFWVCEANFLCKGSLSEKYCGPNWESTEGHRK